MQTIFGVRRYGYKMKALFFIIALCTCSSKRMPDPTPPTPSDTNMCSAACNRLRELKCPEAEPIKMPDGIVCSDIGVCHNGVCSIAGFEGFSDRCTETCEDFCQEVQTNGIWLNPTCVAFINSCNDVNTICRVGNLRN